MNIWCCAFCPGREWATEQERDEHLRTAHAPPPTKVDGRHTLRGVSLGDVYRNKSTGDLYEVQGLCADPQASLVRVKDGYVEHHVIGCLNWQRFQRLVPEGQPHTDRNPDG